MELASGMMNLSDGASGRPEETLTATIELEDLRSELKFLRDSRPGSAEYPTLLSVRPSIRRLGVIPEP
jgi:hypothetical protein